MEISDRESNSVIADVHPILAKTVLAASGGDKERVQWISPFAAVIWNSGSPMEPGKLIRAAGDLWS